MVWPSLVVPGNPILASQFNGLITTFSTWADAVTVQLASGTFGAAYFGGLLTAGAGASFSGVVAFNGAVNFTTAPTFTDAATTRTNLGVPSLSGSNTYQSAASITDSVISTLTTGAAVSLVQNNLGNQLAIEMVGSASVGSLAGIAIANWAVLYANGASGLLAVTLGNVPLVFATNSLERARFSAAGRFLLGTTTDDTVNLLQVNGGISVSGAGTFSGAVTFSAGVAISAPASMTFGTGWQTWTPTVTCSGSMTASGLTISDAQYLRLGPICYFKLWFTVTLGGTASDQLFISPPTAMAGPFSVHPAIINTAGSPTWQGAHGFTDAPGNQLRCGLDGAATIPFPLGATGVFMEGFYRVT